MVLMERTKQPRATINHQKQPRTKRERTMTVIPVVVLRIGSEYLSSNSSALAAPWQAGGNKHGAKKCLGSTSFGGDVWLTSKGLRHQPNFVKRIVKRI
jgi:hypothetical protein